MNYLNPNRHTGHLNFIICLLSIIGFESYHMLRASLIKALKSGKVQKN